MDNPKCKVAQQNGEPKDDQDTGGQNEIAANGAVSDLFLIEIYILGQKLCDLLISFFCCRVTNGSL